MIRVVLPRREYGAISKKMLTEHNPLGGRMFSKKTGRGVEFETGTAVSR